MHVHDQWQQMLSCLRVLTCSVLGCKMITWGVCQGGGPLGCCIIISYHI
jgi:hypothetical protein